LKVSVDPQAGGYSQAGYTPVIPKYVPADGDSFRTMGTRTAKALEQSQHALRYQKIGSTLEFPRMSL
jgi:hypothetical protein